MDTTLVLAMAALYAFMNRLRGSKMFGLTNSTEVGRTVCALGMALGAYMAVAVAGFPDQQKCQAFFCTFAGISLWDHFAWDNYWSAAIGNATDIGKRTFAPVDWLMRRLPALPLRLWGAVAMGLRQALLLPGAAALALVCGQPAHALYGLASLLFGVPYLITGYFPNSQPVALAEYTVGALTGAIFTLIII